MNPIRAIVTVALTLCATSSAFAQAAYPSKPLQFVVPFPRDGTFDILARTLQPALTERLGTSIAIDNRPGTGGNVGTQYVAREAAADGHTLLLVAPWKVIAHLAGANYTNSRGIVRRSETEPSGATPPLTGLAPPNISCWAVVNQNDTSSPVLKPVALKIIVVPVVP